MKKLDALIDCAPEKLSILNTGDLFSDPAEFQAEEIKRDQEDLLDRAFGCILGAFVGDSLGSYTEFKRTVSDFQADNALLMPGGGCWRVAPGQVTDDSELAMCLLHALVKGKGTLDANEICINYGEWIQFGPFDIGMTTRNGLRHCRCLRPDPSLSY